MKILYFYMKAVWFSKEMMFSFNQQFMFFNTNYIQVGIRPDRRARGMLDISARKWGSGLGQLICKNLEKRVRFLAEHGSIFIDQSRSREFYFCLVPAAYPLQFIFSAWRAPLGNVARSNEVTVWYLLRRRVSIMSPKICEPLWCPCVT